MPRKARTANSQSAEGDAAESRQAVAFVTYHGPHRRATPAAKRLIHQQAMKEIGKSRRKPKDAKFVELDLSLLQPTTDQPDLPPASWWLGVRWSAVDNLNLVASFRVEMNALEERLVAVSEYASASGPQFSGLHKLTTEISVFQDDGQQRPLRDAWFSVGMADKAAFMAVLSNSALHMNSSERGGQLAEETAAAIKYQTEAVAIVNERLKTVSVQNNVELWDATIGAVSGLVCNAVCETLSLHTSSCSYTVIERHVPMTRKGGDCSNIREQDIRGSWKDWNAHLRGMQQLIKLRGGIEKLDANVTLRLTVSW